MRSTDTWKILGMVTAMRTEIKNLEEMNERIASAIRKLEDTNAVVVYREEPNPRTPAFAFVLVVVSIVSIAYAALQ